MMEVAEKEIEFNKYSEYKDSGVNWLGEVPSHWDLTRLGTRFEERRTKVSDKVYAPLSVTKNGVVPQLENAAKSNDGDNRKLVKKGDFVINSRSDRKGSSGIAFEDGSVSLINIVMEPKSIHPIFCNYLLKSHSFIEEFYRMGHGIVADLWTTRYDEMKSIMVSIPAQEEQTAIANFLDEKTAKIDEAISIKQKQIELLKERRQILIHKAVTRGLNPDVPLKPSGVDWIGDIPEHWEVKRIKYSTKINQETLPGKFPKNSEIEYVDIGSVTFEDGIIDTDKYIFKDAPSRARRIAKDGDTVISTVRTYLKAIDYINREKSNYIYSTGFAILHPMQELENQFLSWFVKSDAFTEQVRFHSKGMSYPAINSTELGRMWIVSVPIEEQSQIVSYLKKRNSLIENLLNEKAKEIRVLIEYKNSVINSAVTGKIKVS